MQHARAWMRISLAPQCKQYISGRSPGTPRCRTYVRKGLACGPTTFIQDRGAAGGRQMGQSTAGAGIRMAGVTYGAFLLANLHHISNADLMLRSIATWAVCRPSPCRCAHQPDPAMPWRPAECASRKHKMARVPPHDAILGSASLALLAGFECGNVHTSVALRSFVHENEGRFLAT